MTNAFHLSAAYLVHMAPKLNKSIKSIKKGKKVKLEDDVPPEVGPGSDAPDARYARVHAQYYSHVHLMLI